MNRDYLKAPRKPVEDKRSVKLNVGVTLIQKEAYKAAAASESLEYSEWVRLHLNNAAKKYLSKSKKGS